VKPKLVRNLGGWAWLRCSWKTYLFYFIFLVLERWRSKMSLPLSSIWHAVFWSIWKTRDELILYEKYHSVIEVMDLIKSLFWQCLLAKNPGNLWLYYEWITNQTYCIYRWSCRCFGFNIFVGWKSITGTLSQFVVDRLSLALLSSPMNEMFYFPLKDSATVIGYNEREGSIIGDNW